MWLHQLRQGKAAADPRESVGPATTESTGAVGANAATSGSIAAKWQVHLVLQKSFQSLRLGAS